jgi:hypothetical protein
MSKEILICVMDCPVMYYGLLLVDVLSQITSTGGCIPQFPLMRPLWALVSMLWVLVTLLIEEPSEDGSENIF